MFSTNNADRFEIDFKTQLDRLMGDYVYASCSITNRTSSGLEISSRLNLYEGDLRIILETPSRDSHSIFGNFMVDSPLRFVNLDPNQSIQSQIGLFYTNIGVTFKNYGTYTLEAEFDTQTEQGMIKSKPFELTIIPGTNDKERRLASLAMNENYGRSLAIADAGSDQEIIQVLENVAREYIDYDAGIAAQLVLGNTYSKKAINTSTGDTRNADPLKAAQLFKNVFESIDLIKVAKIVCSITPPAAVTTEPLHEAFEDYLGKMEETHIIRTAKKILGFHLLQE